MLNFTFMTDILILTMSL